MKSSVRLMLWLTVLSGSLVVGSDTATGKIAFIERQGDHVHVRYEYGDSYRLKRATRSSRQVQRVRHEHFHYYPRFNVYGFDGRVFPPFYGYTYPFYFR